MKSPEFWQQRDTVMVRLLAPLGRLYAAVTAWRLKHARPWTAPVPVICVGNLTAGGAGKTPIVRDLALRLKDRGRNPGILSRGYGGQAKEPLKVDPALQDAAMVGDEPLLLARDLPCWIAKDRAAGARAMVADGIDIIVMDDGLQNPGLFKGLQIVVVDGTTGFGNGRPIPAGPLREDIRAGLARAGALIVTGDDRNDLISTFSSQIKTLQTFVTLREHLSDKALLAFAGIGRPEKFRTTLTAAGANVVEFRGFADHHTYTEAELAILLLRARHLGAQLVTTEKDWVRLNAVWRRQIKAIAIDVVWQDEIALTALLDTVAPHG
jgi:tetraacyldisaccharide 4'-kinase